MDTYSTTLEKLMAKLRTSNAALTEALNRRSRLSRDLDDERTAVEKIRGDISSIEEEIMAEVRELTGGEK